MRCPGLDGPDGESLVVIGAAVAIQMAQGRGAVELELLSSFFEVLGDNLSLIAAQRAAREARTALCREGQASVKSTVSRRGDGTIRLQRESETIESGNQ